MHKQTGATVLTIEYTIFLKEFWEFLEREKATLISGVPYTYEMLKNLHIFQTDLPSVKTITQFGGKLPEVLQQAYLDYAEQKGKQFVLMYGQTEATARMAYLPVKRSREKIGSIGIAIPGGRFQLLDVNENKITEAWSVGELVYYGPNVALGYATCRQEETISEIIWETREYG